jgi:aspartyl-tRNA(Asn)/glutamyl-tRNA(Gln) amidotransferase subunit C
VASELGNPVWFAKKNKQGNFKPIPNSQFPIPQKRNMIEIEEVKKVAHLARLQLTAEEEKEFTTQLNSILEYFEQLRELDTEKVPPTSRAISLNNITRTDELEPFANREEILACAPETDGEFFKVPKILSEEES